MKSYLKLGAVALVMALAACGGGGGDAGGTGGATGGTGGSTVSADPVLRTLGLIDGSGATVNSINASGVTLLKVKLTDPSGTPLANQLIDVSGNAAQIRFPEGSSALTGSDGIATIKVARASLEASGAGSLTITYSYKAGTLTTFPDGSKPPTSDKVVSVYASYQLAAANVTLTNLNTGEISLPAYGTRQVSVQANLNGAPSATPVPVTFSVSCGQIAPTTVSTNSAGIAVASYSATDVAGAAQSTQGCSGKTIEISASTPGTDTATKTINIAAAPATSMGFVDATPTRIYLANSGGPTQSVVQFVLFNARGEALLGRDVQLTLKTLNGGIPKASIGSIGNTEVVLSTTNGEGKVSVPVFSGTVPTNVIVNAALVADPSVQTDSAVLAIASGRAAQARVSLAIEKLSIEGANFDGDSSTVTMSLADRQGNPVPDGTAVNFVTSGGVMIPPTCYTGAVPGDSRCTVSIRTQNPRIAAHNGRVRIFAYSGGEEDFVDANFNNVYDCGETWTDLGTAFRDDNLNGTFDTGEFSVPRAASASACAVATAPSPQTGDGVWGAADVRMQSDIVFATGTAVINEVEQSAGQLDVVISDGNGNSMPTGSSVKFTGFSSGGGECTIAAGADFQVPNTLGPVFRSVAFAGCTRITVNVTTPLGTNTTRTFSIN